MGKRMRGRRRRRRKQRAAVGSGVRSRFLKPFNDILEENEWRRRAPDGRNGVGFSWRADGKPGRTELEDAAVCSRVSFSSPYFSLSPLAAFLFYLSLFFTLYSPRRKYMSIYRRARDHVIPCDWIVFGCTGRSLSDSRDAIDRSVWVCVNHPEKYSSRGTKFCYILLSLVSMRFGCWSTVSLAKRQNDKRDWQAKHLIVLVVIYMLADIYRIVSQS